MLAGHTPDRYTREMGVSHADFFRILPRAMGAHHYTVDGTIVRAALEEGTLEIHVGDEQVRRIALLHIPYAEVSFAFDGVSEPARTAFRKHFELYYQRGGG